MVTAAPTVERVRDVVAAVPDPELPVLTIDDLGILRGVDVHGDAVVVTITPTYSGCPAIEAIRADVTTALEANGWHDVTVRTELSPAWTTDWMSADGRRKLREYGVAPPSRTVSGPVAVELGRRPPAVVCPQCGSDETEELSRFAATPCTSLWRCTRCREPFDHFKAH